MSKATTDTAINELIRHVITTWGHSTRWGSCLTLAEFAAVVRYHSSHVYTEALAAALKPAIGSVARD